jgi:hypothetical protein
VGLPVEDAEVEREHDKDECVEREPQPDGEIHDSSPDGMSRD